MKRSKTFVRFFVAVIAIALFAALASSAGAADAPISLGIKPVGATGSYFTLNMKPGETRELTVSLGNYGTEAAEAKTFAADAYTIVNGGFGVRLDGEATSGTTAWLTYPAETLQIEAGKSETRTVTVSIPADAKPGEYIAGLVIQNATPTSASSSGSVAINQINRQAIAIAITVPGPLVPGLEINQVTYKPVGERSALSFGVANTGNMHLKPSGEFTLKSPDGREISHGPIQMDSFYAGTTTNVEGLLSQHLNPGDYVASLTLTDAKSGATAEKSLALTVPVPSASAATTSNSASTGAAVNQSPLAETSAGQSTNDVRLVAIGVAILVLVALLFVLIVQLRRRSARRLEPPVIAPAQATILSRATTPLKSVPSPSLPDRTKQQPIPIRQLRPRDIPDSRNSNQRGA
jgi:hypothetical protein